MTNKLASLPVLKFHYARKDCQSGLGITLSSYWKAPKLSTALTSPSGNRILLLLQGTESSHLYVLLGPSGNWILNPRRYSKPGPLPSRQPDPWAQQETLSSTEQLVCLYLIPLQLESMSSTLPGIRIGLFCVQSFISKDVLIQVALRLGPYLLIVIANLPCSPLLPIRCKALHMDGGLGSPAQGCTANYRKVKLTDLDLRFSVKTIVCERRALCWFKFAEV